MSDKGKVLQGDEVPKNKRMMEKGGVEQATVDLPFPKKIKTISWEQGASRINDGMRSGKLKYLWVGENHSTTKGMKLFADMLTDVDEILNSALEDSSYRSIHENYKILMDDVEDIKDDFLYNFPRLKENGEELEELIQASLTMYKLMKGKRIFSIARDGWRDHVQERENMQLKKGTILLVGAGHTLLHKSGDQYSTHNANAYPVYQYPDPGNSIALVPEQSIKENYLSERENKDADPEYAVWVKSKDKSMDDPALFVGQKTAMKNMFGNKISLLEKNLLDLHSATKYESRIIIQESDDETTNTARENLVKKLHKKYNEEDVVVLKRAKNGELIVAQGNLQNIEGEYKVSVMGHGHEDERGVRRLGGRDGKQIAQDLKTLEGLTQHNSDTRLAKVSLMSCFGDTCGASGTSLAQDLKQGLNNEGVKIKGYRDGIDLDSRGHTKGVLHGGLVRDDKGTPNTKPQQQVNPPNHPPQTPNLSLNQKPPTQKRSNNQAQPTAKNPKDTNTPIKHESHIIIQKADDSTTDKARKNLVNKLNQQHGKENVVVIKEIENKKFLKIQGNIENIKGNYQAQIIGHGTEEDGVRKLNKKTGKTIAEGVDLLLRLCIWCVFIVS
jgi:hypothetical protein